MMTGELFEVKNTILKAVSLDGHRISIRNTELRDDYGTLQAIIPGKTLNEISKILDGEAESEVQIFFDENHVMFRFDDTTVVSRLIDGEYLRIDSMLSSDYDTKVTVNKRAFLDNIERSIVLLRETDRKPLVLTITDGCMNLKMNTVVGRLNSDLDIHKIGKDIMIGLNPKFLLDTLRVIDDEDVCLYMTNAKAPCFIRDDENKYIYLILPINFNPAAYDV
jgi:DNA polymerase-3 subunit beta